MRRTTTREQQDSQEKDAGVRRRDDTPKMETYES